MDEREIKMTEAPTEPVVPNTRAALVPKPVDPTVATTATALGLGDQDQEQDGDSAPGKDGAEAAKYRRRLRETEGERDALAGRVERMQRAEVTRLTSDRLAVPEDVFAFGLTLADLLDDDEEVSAALIDTAVLGLLASRPGLAKVVPPPGPRSYGQGRYPAGGIAAPSWSQVLRGGT